MTAPISCDINHRRRRPLSAYSVRAKYRIVPYAHLMFTGNVTIYTAMINNFIQTGNLPYRLIRFVQGWGHCVCNIGDSKCYRPFISSTLLVRGSRQNEYAVTSINILFTYKIYYINTCIPAYYYTFLERLKNN
jgi:hypothetical protein